MATHGVITIDAGTTNTRVVLWDAQRSVLAAESRETGVRNTAMDGNNAQLARAVKDCITGVLHHAGMDFTHIEHVIASGMITSNLGLAEIPHLTAPAGLEDFARAAVAVELPDICPVPIWFIPGIKNNCSRVTLETYEQMDIARGEEVESLALVSEHAIKEQSILVLPGSHTKFIGVNEAGQLTGCLTTISGELLSVITNNTILASAVGREYSGDDYDRTMLLAGYDNAMKVGLSRACFSGRILNMFAVPEHKRIASYLLGAVLQEDIFALKNTDALPAGKETQIIIAGKKPLRQAFEDLFHHDGFFGNILLHSLSDDAPLSAIGACLVVEKRKAM